MSGKKTTSLAKAAAAVELVEGQGLTRAQAGRRLGIPRQTVDIIINGGGEISSQAFCCNDGRKIVACSLISEMLPRIPVATSGLFVFQENCAPGEVEIIVMRSDGRKLSPAEQSEAEALIALLVAADGCGHA